VRRLVTDYRNYTISCVLALMQTKPAMTRFIMNITRGLYWGSERKASNFTSRISCIGKSSIWGAIYL